MIEENEMMSIVLNDFPGFKPMWDKYIEYYSDDEPYIPGPTCALDKFGTYIIQKIQEKPQDQVLLQKAFDLIERFATEGDEMVDLAATTGFLEYLSNVTPEKISGHDFIKYLGPESKAYLKAYDELCGVQMDGLWDEGEPFHPR